MARLTAKSRSKIPTKDFAGPDRSYPIQNASHARNALARVSQFGTSALKEKVRAKVKAKYPNIAVDGAAPKARADRSSRKK